MLANHVSEAPSCRVLVVDDQPIHRLCARVILQQAMPGILIEEASSVAQALAFLAARDYQLVLVDLVLPDGHGTDVIRHLREQVPGPRGAVPAVAMTSLRTPEALLRCARAGLDEVLAKPLEPHRLVRAVLRRLPAWTESKESAESTESGLSR
jgi:CheY-like chemotaxis protein